MKLYAVRNNETKIVIGLVYVRRLSDLSLQIDAQTNPSQCEYKPISECGAIWFDDETDEKGRRGMHTDDGFHHFLHADGEPDNKGWTPVE